MAFWSFRKHNDKYLWFLCSNIHEISFLWFNWDFPSAWHNSHWKILSQAQNIAICYTALCGYFQDRIINTPLIYLVFLDTIKLIKSKKTMRHAISIHFWMDHKRFELHISIWGSRIFDLRKNNPRQIGPL